MSGTNAAPPPSPSLPTIKPPLSPVCRCLWSTPSSTFDAAPPRLSALRLPSDSAPNLNGTSSSPEGLKVVREWHEHRTGGLFGFGALSASPAVVVTDPMGLIGNYG